MTTYQPILSVVMPVFNAALYIRQAVESILNQSFTNFELLIFEDGSQDESFEILEQLSQKDKRIHLFKREKNVGLVTNLNEGIHLAKGEFVARMDADDVSHGDRFQKQIDFLNKNPEVDILGTAFQCFGEMNKTVVHPITNEDIKERLFEYCCIGHPTVMFRKSIVTECDFYKKELFPCEDYHLWVELIKKHQFANLPEVLLQYRMHTNSVSSQNKAQQQELDIYAKIKHYQGLGGDFNLHTIQRFNKLLLQQYSDLSFNDIQEIVLEITNRNFESNFFNKDLLKKRLHNSIYYGFYIHKSQIDYLLLLRKSNYLIFNKSDFYHLIKLYIRFVLSKAKKVVIK